MECNNLLPSLTQLLLKEKKQGGLSPVKLFVGPPYAGKRSLALYLAGKYLNKEDALTSAYFKSIGRLPRLEEWLCLTQLYEENKIEYKIIQKFLNFFLRKFSAPLWEASESKNRILFPQLGYVQEAMDLPIKATSKDWARLKSAINKIMSLYPKSISIEQIRAVKEWAYSSKGQEKYILIEDVHTLSNAGTNSLLKLTEEPPSHFMCVLTTHNKHLIPVTLLSRLRCYQFIDYSQSISKEIIKQYDPYEERYKYLKEFFLSFMDKENYEIKEIVKNFYFALQEREAFPSDLDWEKLFENKENNDIILKLFLNNFSELLQSNLYDDKAQKKTHLIAISNSLINEKWEEALYFNQNPLNFLENLYYHLKKAWIFGEN